MSRRTPFILAGAVGALAWAGTGLAVGARRTDVIGPTPLLRLIWAMMGPFAGRAPGARR